jgi:hypothetical protein
VAPSMDIPLPGMNGSMVQVPGWLSFRRIVDVPFETCVAALDRWQRNGCGAGLRFGASQLLGPMEHDRDSGTCRIQVRLVRGPLRPALPMRLDLDRWSAASTAVELIPCGRVRPTPAYFRAGHLLLDSLTPLCRSAWPQRIPGQYESAADAASSWRP